MRVNDGQETEQAGTPRQGLFDFGKDQIAEELTSASAALRSATQELEHERDAGQDY